MNTILQKQVHDGLVKAIKAAGSQKALARLCGDNVKQGHVYNWLNRNKTKGLPPQYVLRVEKGLNGKISRYQIRPDIFEPEEL